MNKLLVVTVLAALLALNAEGFRVPRQAAPEAELEEEQGTMARIKSSIKSVYDSTVNTAMDYVESIKGMKFEEKAANLYRDTTSIVGMYTGVMQDQLFHFFSSH